MDDIEKRIKDITTANEFKLAFMLKDVMGEGYNAIEKVMEDAFKDVKKISPTTQLMLRTYINSLINHGDNEEAILVLSYLATFTVVDEI